MIKSVYMQEQLYGLVKSDIHSHMMPCDVEYRMIRLYSCSCRYAHIISLETKSKIYNLKDASLLCDGFADQLPLFSLYG